MFEIYKKKFEFTDVSGETNTYEIKPLGGDYLDTLLGLTKKMRPSKQKEGMTEEEKTEANIDALNPEAMKELHYLILETFKKSYPDIDAIQLDDFCAQNLMGLIEPFMDVHFKSNAN